MSDRITIPNADLQRSNYPCWIRAVNSKGETIKPNIICKCGVTLGMGNHSIDAEGNVNVSWYHKKGAVYPEDPDGCGWHVFLKLEGWTGQVIAKGHHSNEFE